MYGGDRIKSYGQMATEILKYGQILMGYNATYKLPGKASAIEKLLIFLRKVSYLNASANFKMLYLSLFFIDCYIPSGMLIFLDWLFKEKY